MSKHVVMVGGGIIGLCCAYYLARSGQRVTLIDRGEAHIANCSFGNAGLVVPSHIVPMAAPGVMLQGLKWMRDPESPFYVKPRLAPDLALWGWRFLRAGTKAHGERSAPLLRDLNMASRAAFEELDDTINERRVKGILKAVPEYYPDFSSADFEGLKAWAGLRPCSPDGLPYVGRMWAAPRVIAISASLRDTP